MASCNVLVKNLESVETLGSTSCICSDKTGTLTINVMTVDNIVYDMGRWQAECGGREANFPAESDTFRRLHRCAAVCGTATFDESSKFHKKRNPRYNKNLDADHPDNKGISEFEVDRDKPIPFQDEIVLGDQSVMKKIMWKTLGDATESALLKFCQPLEDVEECRRRHKLAEKIPFNSANKYMACINELPREEGEAFQGYILTMKGAPERVINRCSHYYMNGERKEMTEEARAEIEALQTACSKDGLRVLGFAEKELDTTAYPEGYEFNSDNPNFPLGEVKTESNAKKVSEESTEKLDFLGLYCLIDPPRPQVKPAVSSCKTAGIRVIMVTGDHPITAKAIAKQVGIIWGDPLRGGASKGPATEEDYIEWNAAHGVSEENPVNGEYTWFDPRLAPAIVVPGWEIVGDKHDYVNESGYHDVPPEKWEDILGHTQIVFARTSPQQKLIIVDNCQKTGEIVAVTGDGVNDAPALKKADIGVAMGIMGTHVSKDAADMILLDDNFASIVAGVEEGRLIFDNLKKSIAYTLSSNIPEITPFLLFILLQIPLALSTVLILCVDLGTDMVPAISMAWEDAESDIMRRPPREAKRDRLVNGKLICFSYLEIGVIQALAGLYTFIVVLNDYGYPPHILLGMGAQDSWGKQTMFCKFEGGGFVNNRYDPLRSSPSEVKSEWSPTHFLWTENCGEGGVGCGRVAHCTYPSRDVFGTAGKSSISFAKDGSGQRCKGTIENLFDPANVESYHEGVCVMNGANGIETCGAETEEGRAGCNYYPTDKGYENVAAVSPTRPNTKCYCMKGRLFTGNTKVSSKYAQDVLFKQGYVPFVPFKARTSVFWHNEWTQTDLYGGEQGESAIVQGVGVTQGAINNCILRNAQLGLSGAFSDNTGAGSALACSQGNDAACRFEDCTQLTISGTANLDTEVFFDFQQPATFLTRWDDKTIHRTKYEPASLGPSSLTPEQRIQQSITKMNSYLASPSLDKYTPSFTSKSVLEGWWNAASANTFSLMILDFISTNWTNVADSPYCKIVNGVESYCPTISENDLEAARKGLEEGSIPKLSEVSREEFFASTYTNASVFFTNVSRTNSVRGQQCPGKDLYSYNLLNQFANANKKSVKAGLGKASVAAAEMNSLAYSTPSVNEIVDYRCNQYIGIAQNVQPATRKNVAWDRPTSFDDELLKSYMCTDTTTAETTYNSFYGNYTSGSPNYVARSEGSEASVWGEGFCSYERFSTFPVNQKEPLVPFYKAQSPVDTQVCYGNTKNCIQTSVSGIQGGLADHKNYNGRSGVRFNVASRKSSKEALSHAQSACFVAIVVVQWADLTICKTRMNSIKDQGMKNSIMNFALIFETLLAAFLCYTPVLSGGLGTRPLRVTHWLPAVPFCIFIFAFDEIRKACMRNTTKTTVNKVTGAVERDPAWLERNTYY